jgi:ABC-type phosphate transport system permease subunit
MLAAGIILAIMIMPYVVGRPRGTAAVPNTQREAALAPGPLVGKR